MLDKCQLKITCKIDGCTKYHHTLLHGSMVTQPAKTVTLGDKNYGKNLALKKLIKKLLYFLIIKINETFYILRKEIS